MNAGIATHFIGKDKVWLCCEWDRVLFRVFVRHYCFKNVTGTVSFQIPSLLDELSRVCTSPNISTASHQIILDLLSRFHQEVSNNCVTVDVFNLACVKFGYFKILSTDCKLNVTHASTVIVSPNCVINHIINPSIGEEL